jgi:hypothetical protein
MARTTAARPTVAAANIAAERLGREKGVARPSEAEQGSSRPTTLNSRFSLHATSRSVTKYTGITMTRYGADGAAGHLISPSYCSTVRS